MEQSSTSAWQRWLGHPAAPISAIVVVVLFGAYLRGSGLGVRSLGHDEASTWYVSRMPLGESLRWQPELTKPPLYQFALRCLTDAARPSEWTLRFPAALCGVLLIPAVWWLVRSDVGDVTALALSGLVACNAIQIDYSQEARPYSMLVLGCTASIAFWYRLVVTPRKRYLLGYVLATVLAFHANYLTLLTVAAQIAWWILTLTRQPKGPRGRWPLVALAATFILCTPIVVHYLYVMSTVFQGLAWIAPVTWHGALGVLEELTAGRLWAYGLLAPSIVLWVAAWRGWRVRWLGQRQKLLFTGTSDVAGLLLVWFICAWFGLVVVSWLGRPAMVVRYALPATVPALALPLIVAYRWDRRILLVITVVFVAASAPDWGLRAAEYEPGIRELAAYLNDRVDPEREAVVLTIDNTTYPDWEEMERAVFRYYPLDKIPVMELHVAPDGITAKNAVLADPRTLYLIVGRADPFPILEAAGRRAQLIMLEGRSFWQLLFQPYRLISVAPIDAD